MTVLENLDMGAYSPAARSSRKRQLDMVFSLLPKLAERREQITVTLSGGEQQMCAIGRGLMSCPRLLMLDEPTLGLAPMLVEEIFLLVEKIRGTGVPVLIVEQQVVHVLECADYAYVLESGRCAMHGLGKTLLENDGLRRAYLETDEMSDVLAPKERRRQMRIDRRRAEILDAAKQVFPAWRASMLP